jgi:hypothetical protein
MNGIPSLRGVDLQTGNTVAMTNAFGTGIAGVVAIAPLDSHELLMYSCTRGLMAGFLQPDISSHSSHCRPLSERGVFNRFPH